MRLFVAVLPPPDVRAALAERTGRLRELPGADGLRWTEPAGWHLTLAFLGEVPVETADGLGERLARAAHRTDPFPLALVGGGRFGDRALWAGVSGDRAALRRLAERVAAAARRAGVVREDPHRFSPHLTLARAGRGSVPLAPFAEALRGFEGGRWQARDVVLVRSRLPRSGVPGERPRYEEVGRWGFRAAG